MLGWSDDSFVPGFSGSLVVIGWVFFFLPVVEGSEGVLRFLSSTILHSLDFSNRQVSKKDNEGMKGEDRNRIFYLVRLENSGVY